MKKLRELTFVALVTAPSIATAGGLFLPGSGAISTSRAGAAVASADDGEALSINPAGLAKTGPGITITLSAAIISYSMEFTRRGTYDNIADEDPSYEGQAFPTVKNQAKPKLGIGSFQPVPVIAVVSDLGGKVKGLHVAAGLYAPNAYPFRDMNNTNGNEYIFNGDFNAAPPPSRYDIVEQDAAVLLPSIAAGYRINDSLDVGARFSLGFANLDSTTTIWGTPGNVEEFVKADALFKVSAKDSFIPAFGLGVTYRPTPNLEFGASYNSQVTIHAKGDASSEKGPQVTLNDVPFDIGPTADQFARCATGGTLEKQKACVDFALPMSATVGGRYKMLGSDGKLKGDIELNLGWENWSTDLASTYNVVVDADIFVNGESTLSLKDNAVRHEAKDTFGIRLGGSYHLPAGDNTVILRGGLAHDTAFAKTGWLRADVDGAARTTFALGGAYRTKRFQIDVGGGFVYEGTTSNGGDCNVIDPATDQLGCNHDGNEDPIENRNGPDPINPIVNPDQQIQSPISQGEYKSHYVMFMLGGTTWF
ncbi:MAG: outer membrane protein transport protein [Kofleriaceae bacterium]